jgi:hypothetical protein
LVGAVGATIKYSTCLDPVPDDAAPAVGAGWRQGLDGALKAVEYMCLASHAHFKSFVVLVAAHFTCGNLPAVSEDDC